MPRLPLVLVVLAACSSSSGPSQGEERGPCYPNETCNAGLQCLSAICVADPDAQASQDSLDAADVQVVSLDGYDVATVILDGSDVAVERVACEPCAYKEGDCDDGDPCTVDECDQAACRHWRLPDGKCQCAKDSDCEDGNPCSKDTCTAGQRCQHRYWRESEGDVVPDGCCSTDLSGAPVGMDCPDSGTAKGSCCSGGGATGCTVGKCQLVPAADHCLYDGDCDDGSDGTDNVCKSGACSFPLKIGWCAQDADCEVRLVCDGNQCVDAASACPDGTACRASGWCEPCEGPCQS